jgi:hypothetical protein
MSERRRKKTRESGKENSVEKQRTRRRRGSTEWMAKANGKQRTFVSRGF